MRIRRSSIWSAWLRSRRGGIAIITSLSLFVLIGFTAGAVDFGNIFLKSRQLQGMADLAALAAANDLEKAEAAAAATTDANPWSAPLSISVTKGSYRQWASLAPENRFDSSSTAPDAARVTLNSTADLYFSTLFLGRSSVPISRSAIAARAKLASFSIGSRLLNLQGGIANDLLSGLTGSTVSLSVMDYDALAKANIDLFQYTNALKTALGLEAASFNETLNTEITTPQALGAIADVLSSNNGGGSGAMRNLALAARADKIKLAHLLSLGPYGDQDYINTASSSGVHVGALDLAMAALGLAQGGRQVQFNLGASVPGITKLTASLAIGQRPNNSPWIAITDKDTVVVRTAQARLYVKAEVTPLGSALSNIAHINVPLHIELASAEAKLSSLHCGLTRSQDSVSLNVRPSIGKAALANVNNADLTNFEKALDYRNFTLLSAPLVSVSGSAQVELGGVHWQSLHFSGDDILAGKSKTVKTGDLMQALFSSLLGKLKMTVKFLGLGLPIGELAIISAVQNSLSAITAPLDMLINSLTSILGLGLGEADLRVNGVRCNAVALVK